MRTLRTPRRATGAALLVATLAVLAFLGISTQSAHAAAEQITVAGQTRTSTGVDIRRTTDALVRYTRTTGATTGTNAFGFEAAVVAGKVTQISDGTGNMAIPANGYVLSGHGTSRVWLKSVATVGATVTIGGASTSPSPSATPTSTSASPTPSTTPTSPGSNPTSVTIDGQTRSLNGVNVYRASGFLVDYTPTFGPNTGANEWGFEAAVVGGKVTKIEDLVGGMAIPSNGYVLSAHGESRTWLKAMAQVGDTVTLNGSGSTPTATATPTATPTQTSSADELLPDMGIRTLRQFQITYTNGKKLLKFPGVTANVGVGPLDIQVSRSSSTSTDWKGYQRIKLKDGTWKTQPLSGAEFYWAGDGHEHWHIKDFDLYEIYSTGGTMLATGEKHGFCFEDNTEYRDWPSTGKNGTSATPVYKHEDACGLGNPQATKITHALSQGWADTYPVTLPDQGIDVTDLPNGEYVVKVTADWQHFWKETNDSNNSASARIRITGDTVTLLSATDGL